MAKKRSFSTIKELMKYLQIVGIVFLLSCAKKPEKIKNPKTINSLNVPNKKIQMIEGRIEFKEALMIMGEGMKIIKHFDLNVSGKRKFFKNSFVDNFNEISVKKWENILINKEKVKKLTIKYIFSPKEINLDFQGWGNSLKISNMMVFIYEFTHFLPKEKLFKGKKWEIKDISTNIFRGKPMKIIRRFNYEVMDIIHKDHLHIAKIKGRFFAESLKPVSFGKYVFELVSRGEMSINFSMDSKVWTKIKGKQLLGWAGTHKDPETQKVITTGLQKVFKIDLYLTE
jgi:hypothetical protein